MTTYGARIPVRAGQLVTCFRCGATVGWVEVIDHTPAPQLTECASCREITLAVWDWVVAQLRNVKPSAVSPDAA